MLEADFWQDAIRPLFRRVFCASVYLTVSLSKMKNIVEQIEKLEGKQSKLIKANN